MNKRVLLLLPFLVVILLAGCKKELTFVEQGELDFSSDTIYFDTLFTTFASPSERLVVSNNSGNNVLISRIYLEKETASDFELIVDGLEMNDLAGLELRDGDSVIVFVDYRSQLMDDFARDRIVFEIGDGRQEVDIEAFVMDAYFYQNDTLQNPGNYTEFGPDKPIVIDGCLWVPEGHTLKILAGTQLHFTPSKDSLFNLNSILKVFGTLVVEGAKGNEVVFQQTRFGERYEENPAQWRGIYFGANSRSNLLSHALVKNALIGIQVDFANNGPVPKLSMEYSEVRNMGAYALLGYGYSSGVTRPMIEAKNCLIHNSKEGNLLILGGGNYRFLNCTFVNYTMDFTRSSPQIIINNYDPDQAVAFECKTDFRNCIIWGTEEEEYAPDSANLANIFDVTFNNCILRTTLDVKGSDNKVSQDFNYPLFEAPTESDATERNYRLLSGSPAINAGQDLSVYGIFDDFDQNPRTGVYDMGAFERVD